MAKHVYHTCDRCGEKLPDNYLPLGIPVDRRPDGAGSMENVVEWLDLCQNCLVFAIICLLEESTYDERQAFVELVRRKKA